MGRPNDALRQLLLQLRQQVQSCVATGQPLPSQRSLADMHGISQATVNRALKQMAREGWVKSQPYRNVLRTDPGPRPSQANLAAVGLRVGLISRRARKTWHEYEIYAALIDEAARRGVALAEVPNERKGRTTPSRSRTDIRRVPWNDFDVGLLVDIDDDVTLSDPMLKAHRTLAVDLDATPYGLDSVCFDNRLAGELAAQHLFELGHRRFAVSDEVNPPGFPCDQAWTERRHGFEATVNRLGGTIAPTSRLEVARCGSTAEQEANFQRILTCWTSLKPRERPTAIYTVDDGLAIDFIQRLARVGIVAPRDLSVVATTWKSSVSMDAIGALTVTRLQLETLVSRTLESAAELLRREPVFDERGLLMNRQPLLFKAPVVLMPGASSTPPRA